MNSMKSRTGNLKIMVAALSCGVLAGCGGGSGSAQIDRNATGSLSLSITDAPVDNVAEVWVQFTGVTIKPSGGPAIEFTFDAPLDVDLLTLTGETSTTLLNGETVPAGAYEWLRLNVNAEHDGTPDSFVLDDGGGTVELEVPSGSVRLVSGFTVLAGGSSSYVIDWDLRKALTDPTGQPGYFLRPALRITDLAEFGTITGNVADSLLMDATCDNDLAADLGNVVYVYEGSGITPLDIDGADPEPLTTAAVAQDPQAAGAYTYSAVFMPPGDYTVAFTCQGLADDPETAQDLVFVGAQDVTVVADQETTADFL
jgi:hypothetical protein